MEIDYASLGKKGLKRIWFYFSELARIISIVFLLYFV